VREGPVASGVVLAVAGAAHGPQVGEYVEPAFGPAYDVGGVEDRRTADLWPRAPHFRQRYPSRSKVASRRRCRSAES
jgi:hypothetical protein